MSVTPTNFKSCNLGKTNWGTSNLSIGALSGEVTTKSDAWKYHHVDVSTIKTEDYTSQFYTDTNDSFSISDRQSITNMDNPKYPIDIQLIKKEENDDITIDFEEISPLSDIENNFLAETDRSVHSGYNSTSYNIIGSVTKSDSKTVIVKDPIALDGYTYCLIIHNLEASTYNCHNCSFSTDYVKEAVLHFVNNGSENCSHVIRYNVHNTDNCQFECTNCNFTTVVANDAVSHVNSPICHKHLKCFLCTFNTPNDDILKAHLLSHLNKKHVINSGRNATFSLSKNTLYICLLCNAKVSSINKHYFKMHGRKHFLCTVCNKQFRYVSDMQRHMTTKAHKKHAD